MATTPPTGAKSNMRNGSPSASPRKVAMMMLGGVPISVTMPPRIVAKESGISDWPGGRPALRAASTSTGIRSARAATLFMKADSTIPTAPMIAMWLPSARPATTKRRVISITTPARVSPAETTRTSATTRVAGWPKPSNAFSAGTRPATTAIRRAEKAIRS